MIQSKHTQKTFKKAKLLIQKIIQKHNSKVTRAQADTRATPTQL